MASKVLRKAKAAAVAVKTKVIKALKMKPTKHDSKAAIDKKLQAEIKAHKAKMAKEEAH